jgi:succinoglycan biosynthesis transport protein ExoP
MNVSNFTLAPSANTEDLGRTDELQRLIATFRRRSRLFISVALVILAAVVLVTFQQTPRYTATSNVMIDTRKREVSNIQDVLSGLPADSSVVDTEVEILKSRSLADRVVADQKLDQDPEFNGALRPRKGLLSIVSAPFAAVGSLFSSHTPQTQAAANLRATKAHEGVVDSVLSRLKVRRSGLTYVIAIDFESKDPVKAAQVANAFANLYLTQQLQDKYDATQQANQWLNQRLAELQPQVFQAEAAVEQYKAQHGLLASVGSSLTEQEISNLNNQMAQAQADQAEHDARLRTAQQVLESGATGENLSGSLNSPTITQLRAQSAELSSKVADLQTKYGPKHPEVQRAERALADNAAQIREEVSRQVSSLQAEAQVARQRVASLQGSLGQAKGALIGNNAASVELADLQRKADAASTLYATLLNRAKQTATDQGSETSDSRIVSRAKIPNAPSFPKKQLNFALGLLLGLAGGVGSVFLMEALDSGLATSEDVERLLGVPHLGAIPMLDSTTDGKASGVAPGQYILDKPLSAFAESFRNLRASILFSRVDTPVKVVLVTSSLPGEGKTTTTFCLGRSMAMSGAKVVVVDCDLRRRNINRLLGIEPEVGLIEVLQGTASLEQAMVFDQPSGAWFLPLAKSVHTPKDLFGSHAMDRLIETLRAQFDLVLLDTAPVIPVSDTRILAPKADVVVFLTQWRKTPRKAVDAAFALLKSVGADIAGVALTLVDAQEQAKYGYGDSGYYYRSYRKYYTQ